MTDISFSKPTQPFVTWLYFLEGIGLSLNVELTLYQYVIVIQCTAFNLTFTQLDLSKAKVSTESVNELLIP